MENGSPLATDRTPRLAPARYAGDAPLYVEVSPLLTPHITGIGRFVARLVEALSRYTPLRLVTTVSGSRAQSMNLLTDLECGEEIVVAKNELPRADDDLEEWT